MGNFKSFAAGLILGIGALGMTAIPANAILIDNGGSTTDTNTNLEWLDLTATLGQSYNSVAADFGGFITAGYQIATEAQVCGLFGALGDTITNCGGPGSSFDPGTLPTTAEFIAKLGQTGALPATHPVAAGFYVGATTTLAGLGCINGGMQGAYAFCITNPSPNFATNPAVTTRSNALYWTGVYLNRSVVSEPGTLALFGLGLVGLGIARRKRAA